MIAKPKKYTILQVLDWKFVIDLYPQQMWDYECIKDEEVAKYRVSYKNITMNLSEKEFDKYFRRYV